MIHHDRYERGIPVLELENGLLPVIGKTKATGTKINFLPDAEIFEKTRFKEDEVKSRLHETAYLNPALTIIYEDKRLEEPEKIVFHEEDGIIGFVRDLNKNVKHFTRWSILKAKMKALPWRLHFSIQRNSMKTFSDSVTISIMQRAERILQALKPSLRVSSTSMRESLGY